MQSGIAQLLLFSAVGILAFCLFYALGLFLYNYESKSPIKGIYLNSFLGFFTFICLYAIISTNGVTSMSMATLPLAWLCYRNKKRFKWHLLNYHRSFNRLLYIFPIVFILYGSFKLPGSIETDVRFYSRIVTALTEFGIENNFHFFNAYNKNFNGFVPYHYTELWLASLFGKILQVKSIIALKYVAYPYLIASVCYGVLGLIKGDTFIFFLIFLGLSKLPIWSITDVGNIGYTIQTDFWDRPNLIIYYYCLLALFYILIDNNVSSLIPFTVICSSISIVIIPCLNAGIACVLLYKLYKKQIEGVQTLKYLLVLLVSFFFYIFLQHFFGSQVNLVLMPTLSELVYSLRTLWKAVLYISFVLIGLNFLMLVLSYLLVRVSEYSNEFKEVVIFILVQFVTGIALFQIFNQLVDAYQIPYFAYASVGLIFIISIMVYFDTYVKTKVRGIAIIPVVIFLFMYSKLTLAKELFDTNLETKNLKDSEISTEFRNELEDYFRNNKGTSGGFVWGMKDLQSIKPKSRLSHITQMGSFICYYTNYCNLPSLTYKDTLLFDKKRINADDYEHIEKWITDFPDFTKTIRPEQYLHKNQYDYFFASDFKVINDSGLTVFRDKVSGLKFVYK